MRNVTTTKFKGLTIEHPHSGEVSRSEIGTLLIHDQKAYHDNKSRKDRLDWAVSQVKKYKGSDAIVCLEDVNSKIRIAGIYPNI